MVRAVLAAGPRNVDVRWEGLTPLHVAIASHAAKLNVIAMLLEAGATVDARTSATNLPRYGFFPVGSTPLINARRHGHARCWNNGPLCSDIIELRSLPRPSPQW